MAPAICPGCRCVMFRETATGVVTYRCNCGFTRAGTPAEALIASGGKADFASETYRRLIQNAANDPANQSVAQECPRCGLDYLTQILVGHQLQRVLSCTCGWNSAAPA
jgi:predicted RNA-binding Zn-ribbon protein involved in translation (DUF1610 family)